MDAKSTFNKLSVNWLASCLAKVGFFVFIALIAVDAHAGRSSCRKIFQTESQQSENEFRGWALRPSGQYQKTPKALNEILQDPAYKVIVLARHGKASEENKFTSLERSQDPNKVELDLVRPLAKKGRRAAKGISELLGDLKFRNVGMWGSGAYRVQETAEPTRQALGGRVKVIEFSRELYYADVTAQMQRRLDTNFGETIPHAFFWGHGKSTLELFKRLTGTTNGFIPTAGVLIVAVKADTWHQVFNGNATTVEAFAWSPKNSHILEGSDISIADFE